MSILEDEDKLLNSFPIQLWLDHNVKCCNAEMSVTYLSDGSAKVDILNKNPSHDTLVSIHQNVEEIPNNIHFNLIEGDLIMSGSKIKTLKGLPRIIKGGLYLHKCKNLENFLGCPHEIHGDFKVTDCNKLIKFVEFPELVSGLLECSNCKNLIDARFNSNKNHKIGSFDSHNCSKLTYLPKFPSHFEGYIDISSCESLNPEELENLPDINEGNLFIFNTCEKYIDHQYNTFIHNIDNQIAIPSWYDLLIVKNNKNQTIKVVEIHGELYIDSDDSNNHTNIVGDTF